MEHSERSTSAVIGKRAGTLLLAVALAKILFFPSQALAGESTLRVPPGSILLAQSDGDDAYDPFADYSEFEESVEEEEDINFFRNGRLMTMGFLLGYRGFTGNLQQAYAGSPQFGLFVSYFFDLRFAMQLGFTMGDHTLNITPKLADADKVTGTVSLADLQVALKYYLNTQNVTRGLADLNPYLLVGFSQVYRTTVFNREDQTLAPKDSGYGFDVGAGLEIPMLRNKMFFGAQVMYQIINFPDEGSPVLDENGNSTGFNLGGDSYSAMAILGVNF